MTTLYKINGQFITWDAAHNIHGYTTTATEVVASGYGCVSPWGDDSGMGGYLDRHSSDNIFEWEFWIDDEETWRGIDALATEFGLYPANCIDTELTNGIGVSPAVYFENLDEVWYLIRDAVGLGWIEENDLENNGWYHVDDTSYEFILFDTTTGKVSYGVESLSEMEFVEAGAFTISGGGEVVFVEQSPFPVVCTYAMNFSPTETVADGDSIDMELPYYASKLYLPMAVVTTDPWVEYYGWDVSEEQPPAPPVVLPTVTALTNLGLDSTIAVSSNSDTGALRKWNSSSSSYSGTFTTFDSTKVYAAIEYATGGGGWSRPVGIFEPISVNYSGSNVIGAKNVSGSSQNFRAIKVARCSDSSATVIAVYDSSNTAYNAFLYRAGGTDYYYVLDGTQSDWTDDLASIGYSLYLTGYVTDNKAATNVGSGIYGVYLYDDSAIRIQYDSGKTYTLVAYYESENGERITTIPSTLTFTHSAYDGTERLYIYNYPGQIQMQRIEYTVS